jgi:hypothetical protein
MSAEQLDDETRERHRLLALLALTSQELPPQRRDSRDLHDYLDTNVEAFDALVAQHRARAAQSATKTRFAWRLAAGIAAVGVLTALVVTMMPGREMPLQLAVERSYAELAERAGAVEPGSEATQLPAQLGFSSAQRASAASKSFAAGIAAGEARLARSRAAVGEQQDDDTYYLLGQWNVLLATAIHSEQPASFWLAQREFGRRLVGQLNAASTQNEQVVSHLRKLDAVLAVLATQGRSGRAEHELAKEVQLFRAHLAPGIDQPH